jgi:hypothetical protein
MFGTEPKVGLATSTLPSKGIQNIEHKDELEVIKQINAEQEQIENGDEEEEEEKMLACTFLHISSARKEAHKILNKKAKRIKVISDATHPPVDVGSNIILLIPNVHRAKRDFRNLVGVVLERNEDGLYRIGTKEGVVSKLYCR